MLVHQTDFLSGRKILVAALVANKVVKDISKWVHQTMVLKVNFEKAYNRMYWDF